MSSELLGRLREVRCDRPAFTADHAECVCRLTHAAADEIDRLRAPFRYADKLDWMQLFDMLPDSGHGKFWKEVLREARDALAINK